MNRLPKNCKIKFVINETGSLVYGGTILRNWFTCLWRYDIFSTKTSSIQVPISYVAGKINNLSVSLLKL